MYIRIHIHIHIYIYIFTDLCKYKYMYKYNVSILCNLVCVYIYIMIYTYGRDGGAARRSGLQLRKASVFCMLVCRWRWNGNLADETYFQKTKL